VQPAGIIGGREPRCLRGRLRASPPSEADSRAGWQISSITAAGTVARGPPRVGSARYECVRVRSVARLHLTAHCFPRVAVRLLLQVPALFFARQTPTT